MAFGKESNENLMRVIETERTIMDKARLEWVVSGLNQHKLTKAENQFIKTILEEFEKKNALTELQEERLENLYKEKSKLLPDKNRRFPMV